MDKVKVTLSYKNANRGHTFKTYTVLVNNFADETECKVKAIERYKELHPEEGYISGLGWARPCMVHSIKLIKQNC